MSGGGSSNVTLGASNQEELQPPTTTIKGTAKLEPSSAQSAIGSKAKVRLVQDTNDYTSRNFTSSPTHGEKVDSGGYVFDGQSPDGDISSGASFSDTPYVVGDKDSYCYLYMSKYFHVYLQYTLDGSTWKTVGVFSWHCTGSATRASDGSWSGSASSASDGSASQSSTEPIWPPPTDNSLPIITF
jgi:hypothetical protein